MRQSACLVINPITVDGCAVLFNCTPVDRASDSMMALTSTAAHPAFRKTCSMLVYSFNNVCLFSISSYYMYKRATSEPKGEVARVKLI